MMRDPVRPITRLDLIRALTPEERQAFEHERRRRSCTAMEALQFSVIFPEIVENLMFRGDHA